jgi:long-subunit acyl-CoA synthetase (AMP-forming)
MILFDMLKDSNPAMAKIVEESASLIDGSYYISQTKSRRQNIIDFFACYLSGVTYVPLRHDIHPNGLNEIIKIIESNSLEGIQAIWSTSGTTGESKLVCHKRESIEWAVLQSIKNWGYTKDDFVYCSELPNSTAILMITLPAILVGADYLIKKFNNDDVRKNNFTMIGWIPEIVEMLDDDHSFKGTRVTMGGDVVKQIHVDKLNGVDKWWASWSMTEVLMPGLIGVNNLIMNPYDGYEVKINEKSELLIKGPGLMLGYLGKDRIGEWFNTSDIWEEVDGGYKFIQRAQSKVWHS